MAKRRRGGGAGSLKRRSPTEKKVPIRNISVAPLPDTLTPEELQRLGVATNADTSPANGSSIAFIFEYKGQRALLGADAHPGVLVDSLARFKQASGETRVRLDLFKLPHHASKANVTTKLIETVDTDCYLVSTNGDTFGHPDDAAIARTILASE